MTIDDDRAVLMAAKARSRMAEQAQEPEPTPVVILDSGKYTFYVRNNVLFCDRYHLKEWREFLGDKAVHALFQEVLELRERLAKLSAVETKAESEQSVKQRAEAAGVSYVGEKFMPSPEKTSDAARPSTQCASCGLNHGACCC